MNYFSVDSSSPPFVNCLTNDHFLTYNGTPIMSTPPQKVNIIATSQNWKDEKYMSETLFNVTVVGTDREILLDKKVVTSTPENAKFVSGLYKLLEDKGLTLDDVTVLVNQLGTVKVNKEK